MKSSGLIVAISALILTACSPDRQDPQVKQAAIAVVGDNSMGDPPGHPQTLAAYVAANYAVSGQVPIFLTGTST